MDRAKANGIRVMAWTADEGYGRDIAFLDGLDKRDESYVVEVPPNAHVWLLKPKVLKTPPDNDGVSILVVMDWVQRLLYACKS